jgi:hypothetical protein
MTSMPAFALATLSPLVLILLGLWLGGLWVLAALVGMTALITALDRLVRTTLPETEVGCHRAGATGADRGDGHGPAG